MPYLPLAITLTLLAFVGVLFYVAWLNDNGRPW